MSPKPRRLVGTRDTASCLETMRALQSFLDGATDELSSRRVANHLEACRRCGLEAATYRELKAALARRSRVVDAQAVQRLQSFGAGLSDESSNEETR